MSGGSHESMLYFACEALWRDVKYCVMERGYEIEQDLQRELQMARFDTVALETWLRHVVEVERLPPTLAGTRNTLYHVYGYWKDVLPTEDRHVWHDVILNHPARARQNLYQLLIEHPNEYLVTSYYWRDDVWRTSWFLHQHIWWQFHWTDVDGTTLKWDMRQADQVLSARAGGSDQIAFDVGFLHRCRLGVQFPTGEHLLYPWFLQLSSGS